MELRKTTLLMAWAILFGLPAFSQNSTAYIARADANNIITSKVLLDTAALNGNSNLNLLLTHNYNAGGVAGVYVDKVLGFRFQSLKWYIFNQDLSAFIPDTYFNVFIPGDDAYAWTHTSTAGNITNNYTMIDDGRINNNPNAKVFVSNVLANYNNNIDGVFYNTTSKKWCIYRQAGVAQTMEANLDFNIIVPKGSTGYATMVHTADGNNTSNHFTYLNHPDLNNNPDAIIFITQVWNPAGAGTGVYNNHNVGVEYNSNNKWRIYNEDLANIPLGASFNVMIFKNNSIGVEEQELTSENIKLYPNPAEAGKSFVLQLDEQLSGTVELEVYSLDGQLVYAESFEKNQNLLSREFSPALPAGMYVLKVENNQQTGAQRLILQ